MRNLPLPAILSLGLAAAASAQITADGQLDAAYGPPLAVQLNPTGYGDNTNADPLAANYSELGNPGAGIYLGSTGSPNAGFTFTLANGVQVGIDNSNIVGVTNVGGSGSGVTTGIEVSIPLALIGNPTGPVKVCAFITNPDHTDISNQVLGGLETGTANLGAPLAVDFSTLPGNQFFYVPQQVVIAGWDNWTDSGSDHYPATDLNGATGLAVGTAPEGQFGWGNWNNPTYANGASADGTWGTSTEPGADSSTTAPTSAVGLLNATASGEMTFTITNTSGVPRDLTGFHFDGSEMLTKAAGSWTLSILAGSDVSTGQVQSGTLGVARPMPIGGFDVDLTGLADRRLENGEVVIFELAFTGGVGDGSGGHNAMIDNVAVTASIITLQVTTNADNGAGSLRQTIIDAPAGITITFDPALAGETITLGGSAMAINKALTISGFDLRPGITLDANQASRAFYVSGTGSLTLQGLTLTGGNGVGSPATGFGGAILTEGTLSASHCLFIGNSATLDGGAISGDCDLINCTFTDNSAERNGSAVVMGNGSLHHCTVTNNQSDPFTGAVYGFGGVVTISNCIVAENSPNDIWLQGGQIVFAGRNIAISTDSTIGTLPFTGPAPLTDSPALALLGNYGGPTLTMPPLPGSPAIDAAVGSTEAFDQRGAPRDDGFPDIGAVEFQPAVVNTSADQNDAPEGPELSLREALAREFASTITFDPSLSGQTITLGGTQLLIDKSLTIDASALPGGITIDADEKSRVLEVAGGVTATLAKLHITGGNFGGDGGGISNSGTLTLNQSTLSGNSAFSGGGIFSWDITLTLTNSIVADNDANIGPDIISDGGFGTITANGVNIVSDSTGFAVDSGTAPLVADPHLAPLGNYGGPTQTMPPLPGSPVINAAGATNPGGTDQRGLPRFVGGALDIGAVEYQGTSDLALFWNTDWDGDGKSFGVEFATASDPVTADNGAPGDFTVPILNPGGDRILSFGVNPDAIGSVIWEIEFSPDLSPGSWVSVVRSDEPNNLNRLELETNFSAELNAGPPATVTITDANPPADRGFYRFTAWLPGL